MEANRRRASREKGASAAQRRCGGSIARADRAVAVALEYTAGVRRRATRGMRTAREAYAQMPPADALVDRAAFYAETR